MTPGARAVPDVLRVAICGGGNRALPKDEASSNWLGWARQLQRSPRFRLEAACDVSPEALARWERAGVLPADRLFTDLAALLDRVDVDAVIICPVAEAHAACALEAVQRGKHVLVEKPFVTRLAEGTRVRDLARAGGCVVGVVQTWRAKSVGQRLRSAIGEGRIGRIGSVMFRYVRDRDNARLPAYLFQEPFPLLYAMGIHHFDLFRYVLQQDIALVSGMAFRPPWSRYESWPGVQLCLETDGGIPVLYHGTLSSRNRLLPQESLLIDGELGSLINESAWGDPPLWLSTSEPGGPVDLTADVADASVRGQYDLADRTFLDNFYDAVTQGAAPISSADDNLRTLAAVVAAAEACETGQPVSIKDLLARSAD